MFFGCFVFSSSFLCSFFGVSDLPPGDQGFYTFLPSLNFVPACVNKSVDIMVQRARLPGNTPAYLGKFPWKWFLFIFEMNRVFAVRRS